MKCRARDSRIHNMQPFRLKWTLRIACCLLAGPVLAWQGVDGGQRRIYVEAFATKSGAEKLREDVTAELRKLKSVSLVSDESNADIILGGGGEIWVRGYRSFSPRSHMKLPTNGMPVYGGFLSVELKDNHGVTLWSYLVTPETSSDDISKDLSRRIAKHLAEALNQLETPRAIASLQPTTALKGAGATFPYPVYAKWITNYRRENPNLEITYDPIGSEAGVRKLLAGDADFGASDSPEVIRQIDPTEEGKYLLFPSVVGAVVPIVNLPGLAGDVSFTPEALAAIYLGKIKKWNDPVLRQANRGLQLPDLDIVLIHRSDGSGTSYAWTDFLSKTVPEWKAQVGSSLTPTWPIGSGAAGNEGVASLVQELGGSIGYVEFIYALQHHLSFGKVRNRNGEFVAASLESLAIAAAQPVIGDDFKVSIVNPPGAGAYPIATFTWLVVPGQIADERKRHAITGFLNWMLGPGQAQAAALGYLPLPKELATREEIAIARIH
jgi:phosphate ABC transporter phosphate-binding protein